MLSGKGKATVVLGIVALIIYFLPQILLLLVVGFVVCWILGTIAEACAKD